MTTDTLSNAVLHKDGIGSKLMLIAHADVVKMMVTYVDERGFLYIKPYGGVDVSILPSQQLVIHHRTQEVVGIVGKKPIHLLRDETSGKISWEDIWVDIGAKDKAEALSMVSIGDYAYFQPSRNSLANNFITGNALDDSCGVQVLHQVAERIQTKKVDYDIYFVESNFEEIGMRGAIVAANTIKPDVCIAIDVTHATDYPSMNPIKDGDVKLGQGCVLALGPNIDHDLFQQLNDTARSNNIPIQIEPIPYPTGTDANVVQVSGTGVKTALVSIPCRYMHTPHEVVSLKDIEAATTLISTFLQNN